MMKIPAFFLLLLFSLPLAAFADWSLPLSIQSGTARTSLTLSIQAGASNGFDAGKDVPGRPYEDDLLYASFPHPGWGVNLGGESVYGYSRDARGTLPQEFVFEVISKQSSVTLSWNPSSLPPKTSLSLHNPTAGTTIDMTARSSYSFNPGGTAPVALSIEVFQGDVSPPSAPGGLSVDERESSLYVSWEQNSEADLAGYKVHFGTRSGSYARSIDVRKVTNYSLFNLDPEEVYYIALTAYDQEGNESSHSSEVTGRYRYDSGPPLSPSGLRVSATATTLTFSWSDNSEEDLAGYKVHLGTAYGVYSATVDVGATTRYAIPNPVAGQTYYLAVSAYDQTGNESELSSAVSGALVEELAAPGVPDGEVLPGEEETPSTTRRGAIAYPVLTGGTGNADQKGTVEGGTQSEQRKEDSEKKASAGAEAGAVEQEAEPLEPDASTSVAGKPGKHRIELDKHAWKLMTIPLQVSMNKPFSEFVALSAEINRLIGWDNQLQSYRHMKYPRPGAAFWLKAGKGYAVLEGPVYAGEEALFALEKGWTLLGSPYLESIAFQNARIKAGDKMLTLPEAVAAGVLVNDLQSYISGEFVHEALDGPGQFKPWRGYWFFAKQACALILYARTPVKVEVAAKPDSAAPVATEKVSVRTDGKTDVPAVKGR